MNTSAGSRRRCILVLMCFFGLCQPAVAQYFGRNKVQYDTFDFRVLPSEHFDLYFYPEETTATRDAARMAERWYHRHTQLFLRDFDKRRPIIFYANDADFQQTNVIEGLIGEGTGGVTESIKERVVMPFTGVYAETDHVLGHELVHSFQYDIGLASHDTPTFNLSLLPTWLIEGMAEYLSLGREDAHTAMWMRDAALRDDLPTIRDLENTSKYFPYRYGQAYLAYIGGKYGDAAVVDLFKRGGHVTLDSAFVSALGITADSLSKEWAAAIKQAYLPLAEGRTPADSAGRRVLARDLGAGDLNLAPALSADGRYVAYLSEQDLFTFNLFVADAATGRTVKKLRATNRDPHFDALRFINSAGTWSPDGRRLAFITFAQGDNELAIWNLDTGAIERYVSVRGVPAMANPAWSPDGRHIAFSGLQGGLSDLYVYDLETRDVRQLTDDRYADLQPAWSPDGRTLAFITDRGEQGTDFETLAYARMRIGLVDLESGSVRVVRPFQHARHVNPQFSPDGRSLYFIADQDGFKDIYRYVLGTQQLYRVTRLQTGVSGITALSPALTVARQSGRLTFSVFSNGHYTGFSLEAGEAQGTPVAPDSEAVPEAALLPPMHAPDADEIGRALNDPLAGLPKTPSLSTRPYRSRLLLDYVAPPTLGVSVGGVYGTGLVGGVGFYFSDMLGNHNFGVAVQASGSLKDIGAGVGYVNRKHRINYGSTAAHIPYLYSSAFVDVAEDPETGVVTERVSQLLQRVYVDYVDLVGIYPFSTTRRAEVEAGAVRYGFEYTLDTYFLYGTGTRRQRTSLDAPAPQYFFQSSIAYVVDYSFFGFTSPLRGARSRFEVAPRIGSERFVRVTGDYRRYVLLKPVTVAVRGLHIGNYGAAENDLFATLYLGYSYYPGFIRGYSFRSFDPAECSGVSGQCPEWERLQGTRIAVTSAEVRLPLLGTDQLGLIRFPYLPTDLSFFVDAGLAWSAEHAPVFTFARHSNERTPVVSTGVSLRFNLLGSLVMELFYAYPFQRPDKGGHLGLQLVPGW